METSQIKWVCLKIEDDGECISQHRHLMGKMMIKHRLESRSLPAVSWKETPHGQMEVSKNRATPSHHPYIHISIYTYIRT